jgi:hypothetical protein
MTVTKDLKKLMKTYQFNLHRSKNHLIWKNADGITIVTSSSPSDNYALNQIERTIKRMLKSV